MISIQVEVPDLQKLLRDEERDIIRDITFDLSDRMKLAMADSEPSGKLYKRGKDSFHIASAPGQPPAVDSSNLLNSIMPNVSDLQGEISLNFYGLYLEEGTVKMQERPFILPSLDEVLVSL